MSVKSAQSIVVLFSTANATTGAAADASSTPTGTLYVNGTANAATVTVTNKATGIYTAAVTLPALSAGDVVSLRVAATVATVAGEGVVWQEVADTKRASDLNDLSSAQAQSAAAAALAAYDAATAADIPTAGQLADAVWDELLAGHAGAGSAGAGLAAAGAAGDPWSTPLPGGYAAGTAGALFAWIKAQMETTVVQAAALAAAVGTVSIHRGDTWSLSIGGLGDLSGREKLWWTVKASPSQPDAAALIQVEETAGLIRPGSTAADGSLVVTDAAAGSLVLSLAAAATAGLTPGTGYVYDVQMLDGVTVTTLAVGTVAVTADVTRATG